jgi:GH25 family lysozyme M1 (1,4-beta-N-acetylmuramidase)
VLSNGRRAMAAHSAALAAAAAVVVLTGGAMTMAAVGAQASVRGPQAGQAAAQATSSHRFTYAVNAFGKKVRIGPVVNKPTTARREKITHPGKDWMGAINAKYAPWGSKHVRGISASTPQLPGIDVSSYQGNINWASIRSSLDFVYAKATEGTYYTNPDFTNQYEGPYNQGIIRGAYHFAIPNNSSGSAQADYFIAHGGGWSGDGLTLPGALDIEYNPYGSECYGLSRSSMVSWIHSFVNEYAAREGVYPTIYSTTDWWTTCTGNSGAFGGNDPLWIANYSASGGGPLPAGWGFYTFWQYADSGSLPGDQDVFNGAYSRLQVLAKDG